MNFTHDELEMLINGLGWLEDGPAAPVDRVHLNALRERLQRAYRETKPTPPKDWRAATNEAVEEVLERAQKGETFGQIMGDFLERLRRRG